MSSAAARGGAAPKAVGTRLAVTPPRETATAAAGALSAGFGDVLFERHPHAALVADAQGHVLRANAPAQWLAATPGDTPLGELMRRAVPAADADGGWRGVLGLPGPEGVREVAAEVLSLPGGTTAAARYLCLLAPAPAAPRRAREDDAESHFRTMADSAPVMVWMAGPDRLLEWVNRPWLAYTGRTLAEEAGNGWFDGVHDEDLERVTGIVDTAFDARVPFTMDYRLRRHDGSYRWISNHGVPRYAPDGSFLGYIGSCFDVHERKDLEERLAERTRALRLADRRKNEFLAMLSHELRNPLAPIANAAGILRLMERDNPSLARVRQIIDRQVEQLRRLVADLVDVTRLTHGQISLHKEQVLLEDLVRAAVENAQARLDAGGHTLRIDLPEARLAIEGDSVRLAQALSSLIGNAAKFTPTPSVIDIAARSTRQMLRITVSDPGQGIRPDFLPHVFELFAQQDQSLARSQGGLGVGLTLARRIAHLHGGEIEASSAGPGRGAQFTLSLPLLRRPSATPRPETEVIEAPQGYRVLVIEDNADSRDVLRLLLEIGGNEVSSAANAEEGLRLAGQFLPQIVLCDLGLPGTDGFALIEPLRKKLAGHPTLFAALTGHGREEDEARAFAAGFDAFLVKPLQPDALGRLLRSYAGKLH